MRRPTTCTVGRTGLTPPILVRPYRATASPGRGRDRLRCLSPPLADEQRRTGADEDRDAAREDDEVQSAHERGTGDTVSIRPRPTAMIVRLPPSSSHIGTVAARLRVTSGTKKTNAVIGRKRSPAPSAE